MDQSKVNLEFPDKALFLNLFRDDIYAVGGCVRDLMMGERIREIDLLVTHIDTDTIIDRLKPHGRVDLVGKSFGVIKFKYQDRIYDIALPRRDIPRPGESRRHNDFIIDTDPNMPVEKDLERRDFRCNSMAVRLSDGTLIDPFHGRRDIHDRRISLTNPQAFPEDPLRVLRAARFASQLNFALDPKVYQAAKKIDLSSLSIERVSEELFKILLQSEKPSIGLEELFMLDTLRRLFPEIYALTLSIQDSIFHPEKDRHGHHSVWEHTKITVDQAARLADLNHLNSPAKLTLVLAALCHDIGKPSTLQWEFKHGRMTITNNRHDVSGEKIAAEMLERLKIFSWRGVDLRSLVPALIRCHHRPSEIWQNRDKITKKAFTRLAADVEGEIDLLIYLDAADRAGRQRTPVTGLDEEAQWIRKKFQEWNVSKETIQPLIMGRDLIPLGVSPGPRMGKILKRLYEIQLDNEFESREQGLKYAKKIISGEEE